MMAGREMSLDKLSELIDITPANLSMVKKGKAIRFTALDALCKALDCQSGGLMEYIDDEGDSG